MSGPAPKFDHAECRSMYRQTLPNGRKVWTQSTLAKHFGVSQNAICRAVSSKKITPAERVRTLTERIGE